MSNRPVHDAFQKCADIAFAAFECLKELGGLVLDHGEDDGASKQALNTDAGGTQPNQFLFDGLDEFGIWG
jgi:hypothetical protein